MKVIEKDSIPYQIIVDILPSVVSECSSIFLLNKLISMPGAQKHKLVSIIGAFGLHTLITYKVTAVVKDFIEEGLYSWNQIAEALDSLTSE